MSTEAIIEALAIPADSRVDQRVPKKLLLEQGAPTAADKRHIQDGIDEVVWIAALKPSNIGVPVYRDAVREYLEIAILTISLRPSAKALRLIELVHRSIPYPLVLIAEQTDGIGLSLAHKRFSQAEAGQVVLDGVARATTLAQKPTGVDSRFLKSLAVADQPGASLFSVYDGWCDRLAALEASIVTGTFVVSERPEDGARRRETLDLYSETKRAIEALRTEAATTKQMNRRVALNLEVKRHEATLAALARNL